MTSILLIGGFVLIVAAGFAFRNLMQIRGLRRSQKPVSPSPEWWRKELLR